MAIVGVALAGLAYWQRGLARQNEAEAKKQEALALEQRNSALRTQSRFLADLARQRAAEGDPTSPVLLALEALPDRQSTEPFRANRPFEPLAEQALYLPGFSGFDNIRIFDAEKSRPIRVQFSDNRFAILHGSGLMQLLDAKTGHEVSRFRFALGAPLFAPALSTDLSKIVFPDVADLARSSIHDAAAGQVVAELVAGNASDFVFSPDGKLLAGVVADLPEHSQDGRLQVWETATGRPLFRMDHVHELPDGTRGMGKASLLFSSDSSKLLSWHIDARLWDSTTGRPLARFELPGTLEITGSEDQPNVKVLNRMTKAVLSPDGTRLATSSTDRLARIWDTKTGSVLKTLEGHKASIIDISFDATATQVITVGEDKVAVLWDIETARPIGAFGMNRWGEVIFEPKSAIFSPDRNHILFAVAGKGIRVSDAASWLTKSQLPGEAAVFSPDGTIIVTWNSERLWLWRRRDVVNASDEIPPMPGASAIILDPLDQNQGNSRNQGRKQQGRLVAAFQANVAQVSDAKHTYPLASGRPLN